MEENINAYMVILLNPRTGEVAGAFRTDLEKVDEDLKSIPLEKLNKIENGETYPDLSHIIKTDCIMALQTCSTPRLWICVNGRWVYLG
jgi:hypothetical protein